MKTRREIVDLHDYLQIAIDGEWIDIDATWEALQRQVPTGLNFTASGLAYWGNDIGGWKVPAQQHTPRRGVEAIVRS